MASKMKLILTIQITMSATLVLKFQVHERQIQLTSRLKKMSIMKKNA